MTKRINTYVSLEVEVTKETGILGMIQGYAKLFDHNTGKVIRTIRGQYILETDTDEDFMNVALKELRTLSDRYTILMKAKAALGEMYATVINEWVENDPQFNDALWHGDIKR